jgi:NADH:ubiquinone oxidoreductase subunit 5 (subunit L)/multisubunit Na+/H+ antiporter MnhA subunit
VLYIYILLFNFASFFCRYLTIKFIIIINCLCLFVLSFFIVSLGIITVIFNVHSFLRVLWFSNFFQIVCSSFLFKLDDINITIASLVAFIGLSSNIYSYSYLEKDPSLSFFIFFLNLFIWSMSFFVFSDGFFSIIFG